MSTCGVVRRPGSCVCVCVKSDTKSFWIQRNTVRLSRKRVLSFIFALLFALLSSKATVNDAPSLRVPRGAEVAV